MRPDLLGGAPRALPASPRFAAGVWKRRGTESSRRGRRELDDGRHDLGGEQVDRGARLGLAHVTEHHPADEVAAPALGDLALDLLTDATRRPHDGGAPLARLVEVAGEVDGYRVEVAPELGH